MEPETHWITEGKKQGATHLLIVRDSFSYEDYPVYVKPGENLDAVIDKYSGKNMQYVIEVYKIPMKKKKGK